MEFLDAYDENKNFIGKYSRDEVHEKGLWHNTVHCWLYDNLGNVYFQVRSDSEKLYTTASGHVKAGETLKEAFGRETKEEIGIDVSSEDAELIRVTNWKMDREKNNKIIKDRAFANIYILKVKEELQNFSFQDGEVIGVVKLNAKDTLDLFNEEVKHIKGTYININNNKEIKEFNINDFLLLNGEDAITKYGYIVEAIKERTLS